MAMGNSDETLNAVIDRAEELARAGEREQAESVYRSALAAGLDVRLDYANLLSEWPGREPEAEELYRVIVAAGDADGLNNLATLLEDMGRSEEADELFSISGGGRAW